MGKKKKLQPTAIGSEKETMILELPSIPNFPYQSRDDAIPPVGVVLILETETTWVLGDWDGNYFCDSSHTKVDPTYGRVTNWCVFLDSNGEAVPTDDEDS